MKLSICFLTRDHEPRLERSLKSVQGLGAEILVADTGSTDNTVRLAQSLGARTAILDWHDDFGAAQNQTIDLATGDWILWLNPDEELLNTNLSNVIELLFRTDALAYLVAIQELDRPENVARAPVLLYPRLFRRSPMLRFAGRLYPHFEPALAEVASREKMQILASEIQIRHHAYLNVLTLPKLRWINRLMELELRDRPNQLMVQIEYGRNLLQLNDPRGHEVLAEAATQVLAVQGNPQAPHPRVASLLEYLMTVSPAQSRSPIDADSAWQLAQRWFPLSPPLLWHQAQRAFEQSAFAESATLLERLLELGRTGAYDRSAAFDPSILAEPTLLNLGFCRYQLGDLSGAEACFAPLIMHPTYQAKAKQGYTQVQGKKTKL